MRTTLIWAAVFGTIAIILGALGAHALKAVLTADQLSSFETGVRYQMYHALFLILIAILQHLNVVNGLKLIRNLTVGGVFGFSFSIYALSMQNLFGLKLAFLGPVTPIGGLLLIAAWALLFVNSLKAANR